MTLNTLVNKAIAYLHQLRPIKRVKSLVLIQIKGRMCIFNKEISTDSLRIWFTICGLLSKERKKFIQKENYIHVLEKYKNKINEFDINHWALTSIFLAYRLGYPSHIP